MSWIFSDFCPFNIRYPAFQLRGRTTLFHPVREAAIGWDINPQFLL